MRWIKVLIAVMVSTLLVLGYLCYRQSVRIAQLEREVTLIEDLQYPVFSLPRMSIDKSAVWCENLGSDVVFDTGSRYSSMSTRLYQYLDSMGYVVSLDTISQVITLVDGTEWQYSVSALINLPITSTCTLPPHSFLIGGLRNEILLGIDFMEHYKVYFSGDNIRLMHQLTDDTWIPFGLTVDPDFRYMSIGINGHSSDFVIDTGLGIAFVTLLSDTVYARHPLVRISPRIGVGDQNYVINAYYERDAEINLPDSLYHFPVNYTDIVDGGYRLFNPSLFYEDMVVDLRENMLYLKDNSNPSEP